jgi:hypothetical protein
MVVFMVAAEFGVVITVVGVVAGRDRCGGRARHGGRP